MTKVFTLTALTSILLITLGMGATNLITPPTSSQTPAPVATPIPSNQGNIGRPSIPEKPLNPKMPTTTPARPGVPSNIVSPHNPVVPNRPGNQNPGFYKPSIPPGEGVNRPVTPIQTPPSSYYIPRNGPAIPINPVRPVSTRPVRPKRHNPRIWYNQVSTPSPWYNSIYYSSPVDYYYYYPAPYNYSYPQNYGNYNSYPYTNTNDDSGSLDMAPDTTLAENPNQIQEEYDQWIISQLEIQGSDTTKFVKHLHKLQNIRIVFMEKRKILTDQLADFKNLGLEKEDLTNIMAEISALDKKFQEDEKIAITKLLKGLSVEQQAKYYSLQSNDMMSKQ